MAQYNQPQGDPEITYKDPIAYIYYLRSRGLNSMQVDQLVTQRFGPGKTQEQRQKEAQSDAEKAGWASTAGTIGGVVVGQEALRGFPNVRSAFGAEGPTTTTTPTTGTYNTSGSLSLNRPVPTPTTTVDGSGASVDLGGGSTPQVISSEGGMSTIKMPTGGTQQVPTESLNDPSFWSNVNWGQVAQGGLAVAQMYNAYKSFKGGDKVGGSVNMAAGAGNLAASGALGASAQAGANSALGGYLIPGLNVAAGAYGAYKTAELTGAMAAGKQRDRSAAMSGAMAGATIGSAIPVVGTAVGAIVGAVAGYTGSKFFGSKKDKGQFRRDMIRGVLKDQGILDADYNGTLADGTKTNFGMDGKKLNTKAMNVLQSNNPNAYEPTVQLGDALAASYGFMGDNARSLSRIYVNGALSNAKDDPNTAIANMRHFAKQQGITYDLIKSNLDEALSKNRIDQGGYNRILSSAQQLVPTGTTAPVTKPKKGEVARTSPGMYMNDQGVVKPAKTVRSALEKFYNEPKRK